MLTKSGRRRMTAVYCTDICWYEMLVTSHQLQDCGPGTGYGGLASGLVQLSQAIFAKSKYQLPRLAKSYCRYQRQHGTTTPVSWGGKERPQPNNTAQHRLLFKSTTNQSISPASPTSSKRHQHFFVFHHNPAQPENALG